MSKNNNLMPPKPVSRTHVFLKELSKLLTSGISSVFIETFVETEYYKKFDAFNRQVATELERLSDSEQYQFDNLLQNEEFISVFVRCVQLP